MRVLMISDVYFPRVNGVSTSIQTFAREFVALGHEVTLLAPDYGTETPEPFEVIRIPSRYFLFDPEDRILRWGRIRPHRERLRGMGFDLVHIHTPFIAHYVGVALARWLSVPVIASYHTFFEQYLDKYIPLVPGSWMRFVARHFSAAQCNDVDALAVPSRAMHEVLERYGVQTPAEVVPTGIDLAQFSGADGSRFRRAYGIPATQPLLVHAGRLAFEKNCDFLLHMLVHVKAAVPDVLLVIAGEGPARRQLESLTRRLGLTAHVRFIGYLPRDGALEDFYAAGDAFVFASRTETQGLVLLESLALGTPVVSTAQMGTREVLEPGSGCLIAEEDVTDFAGACVRILRDETLRGSLSESAVRYAHAWSAPAMARRMLRLYARVAGAQGEASAGTMEPAGDAPIDAPIDALAHAQTTPVRRPATVSALTTDTTADGAAPASKHADAAAAQADAPAEERRRRRALP